MEILSLLIVVSFAWYFIHLAKKYVRRKVSAASIFATLFLEYLLLGMMNFSSKLMGLFFVCALAANLIASFVFLKNKQKQHSPSEKDIKSNSQELSDFYYEKEKRKKVLYEQWYSRFSALLWIVAILFIILSFALK